MKVLTNLNLQNLRQNRARTIMTIIGVALSVALILAVIGIVTSYLHTERVFAINSYGDFHIMYRDLPGDKVSILEESKYYDVQYYANQVGCVQREGYTDCYVYGPYLKTDYEAFTDSSKIIRDDEHFYNVFLKYKNPTEYEKAWAQTERALQDAGYSSITTRHNTTLADLDGAIPETARIIIWSFATLVIGVMAIVAAFVIRNSFNISITERVRQFGMLASIGARPRQIRRMVYQEALMVGLVAIPLGILLGMAGTFGVVATINGLLGNDLGMDMLFYIPFVAYAAIIGVGLFIIFLSAASPAIVASRVSPIAALRNVQDIKVKARKVRTSKLTQKIWGIGGVIAAKNLKRSRQKYRTTVISIVLSVSIFIGVASFMSYGYKILNLFFEDTGANVIVGADSSDAYKDIAEHFNLEKYAYYSGASAYVDDSLEMKQPQLLITSNDEFERFARKNGILFGDYSNMSILLDSFRTRDIDGNMVSQRTTKYKAGDEAELRFSTFNGAVIEETTQCDKQLDDDVSELEECDVKRPVETVSDTYRVKITAIADNNSPLGFSAESWNMSGLLFIPESHPLVAEIADYITPYVMAIADSGHGEEIKEYVDNDEFRKKYNNGMEVFVEDIESEMKTVRNTILLFEILIYGFIAVVSLIGVTNIFNTITTNIALRAKEFAVLKSIGMTNKEFNRMIRLESAMYTTRALLIGLPLGLLMSYGISRLFSEAALDLGWIIPWVAIVICIVVVALLVAVIMRYSVRKIKKQNIIETIRKQSF